LFNVRGFGWVWVGLGQLFGGLGWAESMKIDPRTTLGLYAASVRCGVDYINYVVTCIVGLCADCNRG